MTKRTLRRAWGLYRRLPLPIAARIAGVMAQARLLKRPFMKYMDVSIDYACNMSCDHCFQGTWKREGIKLTADDYDRVAREGRSVGLLHVNIQGGEPLLIKQLPDIARAFVRQHIWVSLTTNGYLVTPDWIAKLKKMGIRQLITSLDSMDSDEHDTFRHCEGAHERAAEAIRLAREAGMAVSVNVTVSRQSFDNPKQIALLQWLRENNIAYNPIIATPSGNWSGQYDVMLTPGQIEELGRRTDDDGLGVRDITASWVKKGCPATIETTYLTPYGDLMPCPFIHVSLGNVRQASLADIWRSAVRNHLHGAHHDQCWIGENLAFARAMHKVAGPGTRLPVSIEAPGVLAALSRFWNGSTASAADASPVADEQPTAYESSNPESICALPVLGAR